MFLFDLYNSDTVQLITVTQKHCFHLAVSTRMILCRVVLHALCYSLGSVKLGTWPWYSTGPYPKLFTSQLFDDMCNERQFMNLITFYIISWVIKAIISRTTWTCMHVQITCNNPFICNNFDFAVILKCALSWTIYTVWFQFPSFYSTTYFI